MTPVRVIIADDHPIVREGLQSVISDQPDMIVVGQAATGAQLSHSYWPPEWR